MPDLIKTKTIPRYKLRQADRQKGRKYNTGSTIWRRIRERQLARQPLCEHCSTAERPVPGTDVDHKDGDTYNNRPSNLQTLCRSCHAIKTNRYDGGFGNNRERY